MSFSDKGGHHIGGDESVQSTRVQKDQNPMTKPSKTTSVDDAHESDDFLDDIREIVTEVVTPLFKKADKRVDEKFAAQSKEIGAVKGGVVKLTSEVDAFRGEMTSFQGEMTSFQGEMTSFRSETSTALAKIMAALDLK